MGRRMSLAGGAKELAKLRQARSAEKAAGATLLFTMI